VPAVRPVGFRTGASFQNHCLHSLNIANLRGLRKQYYM
jgi:hypothetical protein